jgi:hypothetical protein
MKNRKKIVMEEINSLLEKRYLDKKYLLKEEESDLPEFQVTPEGMGKSKIKFTWKSKGVNLPKDVRDSELFNNPEFEPLKKIYANEDGKEEATKVINDFIKTKTYIFKKL